MARGFPAARVILGGDHLGPFPYRSENAAEAMVKAREMVRCYVEAGFTKIHLDTSMGCRGELTALPESITSGRAARLAAIAEKTSARCGVVPWYVIGTEVPIPGGAHEIIDTLAVTSPEAASRTYELHREAFKAAGIGDAFARVVGLVVQPGVEFSSENVVEYVPERAANLSAVLKSLPGLVFEAHSTDYQPAESLNSLVQDGFAILKIGPALTFAMREALYGLDAVNRLVHPESTSLIGEMDKLMLEQPAYWHAYYSGSETKRRILRHFSYSDRIRYYWPDPQAQRTVNGLLRELQGADFIEPLISQYLPRLYDRVRSGDIRAEPHPLIIESIRDCLRKHFAACG